MSQIFTLASILLFISVLLGSSVSATPLSIAATFRAPQVTVTMAAETVSVGETQRLHLHLDQSAERVATVVLVVTYANGVTERSLHSARGSEATLTWAVPHDAGMGKATFSVSVDGCGCGQKGTVPPPTKLEGAVTGLFYVAGAR